LSRDSFEQLVFASVELPAEIRCAIEILHEGNLVNSGGFELQGFREAEARRFSMAIQRVMAKYWRHRFDDLLANLFAAAYRRTDLIPLTAHLKTRPPDPL
jgi:hypothetical protein